MDNDKTIKKIIVKVLKKTLFNINYKNINVYNETNGNELIRNSIMNDGPLMISRFGATEIDCINSYVKNTNYTEKTKKRINELSGVYPNTKENLDKFSEFYLKCSKSIDILALWGIINEKYYVKNYCSESKFIRPVSLEPYYFNNPWSEALEDKKVLVIHPFKKSIQIQYAKREFLFKNNMILPKFKSLDIVKAVQSIAGQKTEFGNWFDAYDYMCNEISNKDFDIAIIGAGAYGLPLSSFVKSIGKKAIHLGGPTQILFGIKGKRWDNHKIISQLYNDYWIRPCEEEIPVNCTKVEGGTYW